MTQGPEAETLLKDKWWELPPSRVKCKLAHPGVVRSFIFAARLRGVVCFAS